MNEFYFVLKTFAFSLLVVLAMQVQLGERSIESHAVGWMQSSAIVAPLNSVARGAAKLAKDTGDLIRDKIHGKKAEPKKRLPPGPT